MRSGSKLAGSVFIAGQSTGNYDVSKMHYEGPNGVGYGYDIRVEGKSSANPPASQETPAQA